MEEGQRAAAEGAEGSGEAPSLAAAAAASAPPPPTQQQQQEEGAVARRPSTAESIDGSTSSSSSAAALAAAGGGGGGWEEVDRSIGGSGSGGSSSTTPRGVTAGSSSGGSGGLSSTTTAAGAATAEKVKVLLMGVGRAPRLAQSKFVVQARDPFRALYPVLRRLLQLQDNQALFLFVASSFSPGPEDSFGDLFRCFGKTGQLIVNYALDEAWG